MRYTFIALVAMLPFCALAQRHVDKTDHFTIEGLVKTKLTISIAAILQYPQQPIADIGITNQRGEHKADAKGMKGVLLKRFIDSAGIEVARHKDYNAVYIVLKASDGYTNVYSWNELFNNDLGDHVYIVTQKDGKDISTMDESINIICTTDMNTGRRHLKGLARIEVRKVD